MGQRIETGQEVSTKDVLKWSLILTIATLGLAFPLPTIIAAIAVITLKDILERKHWAVVLVGGVIGTGLGGTALLVKHFIAYGQLFGVGGGVADVFGVAPPTGFMLPPLGTFAIAAMLAGIAGLMGEGLGSALKGKDKVVDEAADVVPEDRAERRMKNIKRKPLLDKIPGHPSNKSRITKKNQGRIPVGRDAKGKPIFITDKELSTHMFLLGSTGSGKTESLKWLAGACLDMDWDVTIIDLKEDTEPGGLRDFCRAYALDRDVAYQEVSLSDLDGKWWLNSLAGMGPDDAFNAIMALSEFDDQYHQNMNRKAVGQVMQMMYHARSVAPTQFTLPSMFDIGMLLQNLKGAKRYQAAIDSAEGPGTSKELYPALHNPDKTITEEAASFGTRLTNLYDSQAGRKVLLPGNDRVELDVTAGGIAYLGLSVLGQPDTSKALSAAVLQRIAVMTASVSQGRLKKGKPRMVIVDEASSVNREIVIKLLQLARSANVRMCLATQSGEDWQSGGEDDWGRLTQNTNVAWIMRQGSPSSAQVAAEYLGTHKKSTFKHSVVDGELTSTGQLNTDEEYLVDFEDLRKFEEGEFVLRVGKPYQISWGLGGMRTEELKRYLDAGRPLPSPEGWIYEDAPAPA